MAYYLALPVLVGYFPEMMKTKVWGEVNVAYVFALSQFIMAWVMAFLYVRVAAQWDKEAAAVIHGHWALIFLPRLPSFCIPHLSPMSVPLIMFLAFVGLTLLITFWAAKKNTGASAYFAAGRSITGWQNGLAVAGDYMSAASFLGISGMIYVAGYDGFMYSVGFLVAYITVLLIVAEPLRNAGKYTMADLLAYRLKPRPVRALASLSTLVVSTFYMIAQMVGAGAIIKQLIGIDFEPAVIGVGVLMLVYVVFGGMLATTWVQIIKALLLMVGALLLSYLVLQFHDFSFTKFFDAVAHADYGGSAAPKNLMEPGLKFGVAVAGPWGPH
jgi:cation/acetate symporter